MKSPARIDFVGAALLSAGLTCHAARRQRGQPLGLGLGPRSSGCSSAAAVLLVVWVLYEQRVPEPLVDIDLLRLRGVWTTNLDGAS